MERLSSAATSDVGSGMPGHHLPPPRLDTALGRQSTLARRVRELAKKKDQILPVKISALAALGATIVFIPTVAFAHRLEGDALLICHQRSEHDASTKRRSNALACISGPGGAIVDAKDEDEVLDGDLHAKCEGATVRPSRS